MHTKSILSLLACAATLISAQDAGLTPDQTTAIEVAASTFEAGLMTQPAFSSLEELLATATTVRPLHLPHNLNCKSQKRKIYIFTNTPSQLPEQRHQPYSPSQATSRLHPSHP